MSNLKETLEADVDITEYHKKYTSKDKKDSNLPDIPFEHFDLSPITIKEVVAEFNKNIHNDEDINITIPLAFNLSNFSPCDPDVLCVVAPSGSGKTEVLRSLGDCENQFIYPLSSLTSHSFATGLKNGKDLAPQLRGRLITIKDFTVILSKNKDEVSAIFADIRDVTDGYLQKIFGSEVGKKEYRDLHSSFLLACTNSIERYYSLYSILGQRLIFFRPSNDPKKARQKAMENAGKEKEIRGKHHEFVMRLMTEILITRKERLIALTHNLPGDMVERIGTLCDFLSVIRTHINRDQKGDMCALPEPELPTRLTKTLCKIVDAHALLFNRLPTIEDEVIALRLVHDNIPTERQIILKELSRFNQPITTSAIATEAKLPTSMTNRVLNDLAALEVVTRYSREELEERSDKWFFPEGLHKTAFLVATNHKIMPTVAGQLKGVNRVGIHIDTIYDVNRNLFNNINKDYVKQIINAIYEYLSESHPSINQDAESEQPKSNRQLCGICNHPLNGNSEDIGLGLGLIHSECKYLLISVKFSRDIPLIAGVDNQPYGPFKSNEIGKIPAINAYALIGRKVVTRVEEVPS